MSRNLAFVGDIHGNLEALRGVWDVCARLEVDHVVFLGDYINKGEHSAQVLRELISYEACGLATLLAGNHEVALLAALDSEDLSGFLKLGGAMTIRSYIGTRAAPDVFGQFKRAFPTEHLAALRRMATTYEAQDVVAQHVPTIDNPTGFRISAHSPVGELPRIDSKSAQLDTGCGAGEGRLTAFLWPSRDFVQVDSQGSMIEISPGGGSGR